MVQQYLYRRETFFRENFPFAVRIVRNRTEDFNLSKRFRRMFWKITFVLEGSGSYIIGGHRFPFQRNSIIVVHPGAETTYDIAGESLTLCNLIFDRSFLQQDWIKLHDPLHFLDIFSAEYRREYESPLYLLTATREIAALIRSIAREFADHAPNREALLKLRFCELLLLILRRTERMGHRNPEWTAHYIRTYLQKHFAETLSQRALAAELGLSPERLCRLYREQYGISMMAELKRIRLEHALDLMRTKHLPEADAARQSGFRDPAYFRRVFAAFYGCLPEDKIDR